jgi:hypothetical protein
MTEHEIARRYVLRHLSTKEMRARITDLFLGAPVQDIDAEYLFNVMKAQWDTLDDSKQLAVAQAVAGARHYNAFLELMVANG